MLNAYPVEEWNGGKVHRVKADIIHLMRGQIYTIDGKTFLTFGGALSIDREGRVEGETWWKEEMPTYEELDEAVRNLRNYQNQVDYIITHSCSERALQYPDLKMSIGQKCFSPEVQMLSYLEDIVTFKHWWFGHFHIDAELGSKYTAILHRIVKIV